MHWLMLDVAERDRLWAHLLPETCRYEQAAFLFCRSFDSGDGLLMEAVDQKLLGTADFAAQHEDYIELTDQTRIDLIKRAHQTGTALAELHSHPGPWPAAFSQFDWRGFKETVPHMHWRLKQRPYLAIVVAPSGYDALIWPGGATHPEPLAGIKVGGETFEPTNNSVEGWDDL